MAKLKLNLTTGAVVEKTILSGFKVEEKVYVVLDADSIGSMGLPIILVCKIDNNKITKITDANEWQEVKGYLKEIVAGTPMNYVKIEESLPADEIYYTQLTLPIASFDMIKNNYKVEEASSSGAGITSETSMATPMDSLQTDPASAMVNNETPAVEPITVGQVVEPVSSPPVGTEPLPSTTVPSAPASTLEENPNLTSANNTEQPVIETPINNEISPSNSAPTGESIDFAENKATFMKACENMFDALVAKFEAQINKK